MCLKINFFRKGRKHQAEILGGKNVPNSQSCIANVFSCHNLTVNNTQLQSNSM